RNSTLPGCVALTLPRSYVNNMTTTAASFVRQTSRRTEVGSQADIPQLPFRECDTHVPMTAVDLGCAKTPAVAPHVEISPGNCIPESQIILHTRGSMLCWRIVFSTFCGCMSFYTGSIKS